MFKLFKDSVALLTIIFSFVELSYLKKIVSAGSSWNNKFMNFFVSELGAPEVQVVKVKISFELYWLV